MSMISSSSHPPAINHNTSITTTPTSTSSNTAQRRSSFHNHHENEFVNLLKSTSNGSGKNGCTSNSGSTRAKSGSRTSASFSSATSSIEDLLSALKQHERHQQRKQKQKQRKQKQPQIQIDQIADPSSTMSTSEVSAEVAHTIPPSPPPSAPLPHQATARNATPRDGDYPPANPPTPSPLTETTTRIDSPSASPDDTTLEEDEARLLRRLELKRREIDEEIEAFKIIKEEEYAEYEARLRERWRRKKEREREKRKAQEQEAVDNNEKGKEVCDEQMKHNDGSTVSSTSAQHNLQQQPRSGILKEQSRFDDEPDELPFAISSPAALMALNEKQNSVDPLTPSSEVTPLPPLPLPPAPAPRAQTSSEADPPSLQGSREENPAREEEDKSPPFEKEIQAAGLFTPTFLPLLDDTYSRTNPTATSPRPITPTRPYSESPAQSQSYTQPASPGAPLASSLKHSSSYSSGFSSGSGPRHLKPKSPKKVSFKLDEAKPVPSRSTPPQTVLTFGYDDIDQSEDPDVVGIEQVETLNIRVSTAKIGVSPRSTAPLFGSRMTATTTLPEMQQASSVSSSYRDSLVVPTRISDGVVEVAGGGQFREGGISLRTDDHDWESVDKGDVNGSGFGAVDDDDEDLFDMDETLPISPTDEDGSGDPGIRPQSPDFEEAIWMGVAAPSDIIATPHGLREAASLPKYSPMSPFGSLGIQHSQLPSTGRRGSVPFSFENLEKVGEGVGVPGGLPIRSVRTDTIAIGLSNSLSNGNGSSGRKVNGGRMNGGFRRKSVSKYVDEEPDTPPMKQDWNIKGKNIEGGARFQSAPLLEEDEEDMVPPTTFGSSLPMAIHGRDAIRKVSKIVDAVKEEELSPGTVGAPPGGDAGDDERDGQLDEDEVDKYGDSPDRPAHVHSSPSGSHPLFATDEEYQEHRYRLQQHRASITVEPEPATSPASNQRRDSEIIFTSPFPAHPVPPAKRDSVVFVGPQSPPSPTPPSPTSETAAPRESTFISNDLSQENSPRSGGGGPALYAPPAPAPQYTTRQQLLNPFTSPASASPYATALAARVAAEAEENGCDNGIGSMVGGVDGGTGLDPSSNYNASVGLGVAGRRGSLAMLQSLASARAGGGSFLGGNMLGGKRGSVAGQGGEVGGVGVGIVGGGRGKCGEEKLGVGGIPLDKMSFSMRLALEEHMEKVGSIRGR